MMLLIQGPEWKKKKERKRLEEGGGGSRIGWRRWKRRCKARWAFRSRGPTRGFKGALDVDVAEARKARQLGDTAGCQNLCPSPPPPLPNRTTTYAQTSFFSSSTSSTDYVSSIEPPLRYRDNIMISIFILNTYLLYYIYSYFIFINLFE